MTRMRINLFHDFGRFVIFILDSRDGTRKCQTIPRQEFLCYIQDSTTFLFLNVNHLYAIC